MVLSLVVGVLVSHISIIDVVIWLNLRSTCKTLNLSLFFFLFRLYRLLICVKGG